MMAAGKLGAMILKSAFGSVRPYTRHINSCAYRNSPDHTVCKCPKWLYEYRKGEKPKRYTLNTPSWAEAQRIADKTWRGFDPEIAEARAAKAKQQEMAMTVADACRLWITRTESQFGSDCGSLPQYKSLMKKLEDWAAGQGIEYVQNITPLQLQMWYSSRDWLRYAAPTRSQRWGILRSMFTFLRERGVIENSPIAAIKPIRLSGEHVQGPYTDEQITRIFAHVRDTTPPKSDLEDQAVYIDRLNAFLLLLLHTGCDVVDAVLFDQNQIEPLSVDGRVISVFRYHRQKTRHKDSNVLAVIPLQEHVVRTLREVPSLAENPNDMPFRSNASDIRSDVHLWSRRIGRVLKAAGIRYVELPDKDLHGRKRQKKANAKQFRHTFAVRQLRSGQRPEEVARMLGHVDTTMVRKHYAPWVPELDHAHIRTVIQKWD
jgi:integrase